MNEPIGKGKLIKKLATASGYTQEVCGNVLEAFMNVVRDALAEGDRVVLPNFLTFEVTERAERTGRNLQTGETVVYPAVNIVKCKISKALKDAVRQEDNE